MSKIYLQGKTVFYVNNCVGSKLLSCTPCQLSFALKIWAVYLFFLKEDVNIQLSCYLVWEDSLFLVSPVHINEQKYRLTGGEGK